MNSRFFSISSGLSIGNDDDKLEAWGVHTIVLVLGEASPPVVQNGDVSYSGPGE